MTFPQDTFQIRTPENVDFGYEIAGIGSRFLAALVDTLLIALLQAAALLLAFFILKIDKTVALGDLMTAWIWAFIGLISFGFFWSYYIFFESIWNGQTPGKRKAGLRVMRLDGTPIGFAEAAIRNLVRLVDFLPAGYAIGIVVMFIDPKSRRLGDWAAGTLVVRDKRAVSLDTLEKEGASLQALASTATESTDWPVERLTAEDRRLVEDYLRRRDELANRPQLCQQIARRLREHMGLPELPANESESEAFILEVFRSLRQQ